MAIAGEVQPGPGEYGFAGRYEVCSSATHEPSFTIPGGRGIGNRECEPALATDMLLPCTANQGSLTDASNWPCRRAKSGACRLQTF